MYEFTAAASQKIGDVVGRTKSGEEVVIKRLHELCSSTPGPHVHVVTTVGEHCTPLLRYNASYDPMSKEETDAMLEAFPRLTDALSKAKDSFGRLSEKMAQVGESATKLVNTLAPQE